MTHEEFLKSKKKYTIGDIVPPYGTIKAIIWLDVPHYLFEAENKSIALISAHYIASLD